MKRFAILRAILAIALVMASTRDKAYAEIPNKTIKIGVLTDLSGPFADQAGKGSVVAAEMAAEDFKKEADGIKVEVVSADLLHKVDVSSAIVRRWIDQDGVDAVVDIPNSGITFAVGSILNEKNRVTLASTASSSDITGKYCTDTTVQWNIDTWALGNALAGSIVSSGGKSWYFVTVDYALGRALEKDTTDAIDKAGGKVVGSVRHPLGALDYASYLLQAQAADADVIALADTGTDTIGEIKQLGEFGIINGKTRLAALYLLITDVQAIGLEQAHGLILTSPFYWDLNDKTRAFTKRFTERMNGRVPTMDHAGVYSSTLAYLRAAKAANTIEGRRLSPK